MALHLLVYLCAAVLAEAKERVITHDVEVTSTTTMFSRFLSFSATAVIVQKPLLLSAVAVLLGRVLLKTGPKTFIAAPKPVPHAIPDTDADDAAAATNGDDKPRANVEEERGGGGEAETGDEEFQNTHEDDDSTNITTTAADASAFYDRLRAPDGGILVTRLKGGKEDEFELRVNDNCELVWPRRSPLAAAVAMPNAVPLSTLVAAFYCDASETQQTRFILQFQQKVLHLQAPSATEAKAIVDGFQALRGEFRCDMFAFVRGLRRNTSTSTSRSFPRSFSFSSSVHSVSDDASSTATPPRHMFRNLSSSFRGAFRARTHELMVAERCVL